MSKQHILDIIQTAQGRAVAIHSTASGFAFNEVLSLEGYLASIDEARDAVFQYIALQSRLNAQRIRMLAAGRVLAGWSNRMLCAIHSTFGKDSPQYAVVAAVKSSAPRRRPRKRRGAALAAGRRAAESMPDHSTARGPVEEIHPIANEGLADKDLADGGRRGDVATQPRRVLGVETEAVRRIEARPPRSLQEGDDGPADAVERGEEIEAADSARALADALALPAPFHEAAPEDGNDEEPDLDQVQSHVAEGVGDPCEEDGGHEGGGQPIGGGSDNGSGQGQAAREASGGAQAPVCHGRGGGLWRGCGWEGARRLETRKMASRAVPWTTPKAILKE